MAAVLTVDSVFASTYFSCFTVKMCLCLTIMDDLTSFFNCLNF